ncbi:MAG: GNAT family N-acetyltransferase [Planctomycetes bacterium]|nr:GNAT family N-acetyltransferase [Planctomycetota bacterium]
MELSWRCLSFDQLTPHDLYAALDLRIRVFVVEQNCPYRETDGMDLSALHLLGAREGELLATARLFAPGVAFPEASIGRVVSSPDARGEGVGQALMAEAIQEIQARWPGPIQIGAQRYLERFYGSFGFAPIGEPYLEDGIPHIHMLRA